MTTETMLIAAVVSLAGAIGVLWRMTAKRWNECEVDRRELHKQVNQLHKEIKSIVSQSCSDDDCDMRRRIHA